MSGYFYRGRHRAPTETGRRVAAVAAAGFVSTGSFVAVGAGEAHAADAWDVIAECESDNRNVNNSTYPRSTASGYFQIIDGTWRANGGLQFAPRAILATRAEQQIVAQRIAANRGSLADWNASKGCWGDQISSSVPRASTESAPAPAPAPAPKASVSGSLGVRAADGSGQYRCSTDKLYFEACDPDNIGEIVSYPLYSGVAAPAAKPKHSKPAASASIKPVASAVVAAPASSNSITDAAKQLLGVPYKWGGASASGVDCSGLVYLALRANGYSPPRTAAAMQNWAKPINESSARAGDLFFWSPNGGTATHVGIYLGDGNVIESSRPGTTVSIRSAYSGMSFGRIPA